MSFLLGLTGSIGMGKSTAAQMFADSGIPVWDADKAVHELYQNNKTVIEGVGALIPKAVTEHGLDRSVMRRALSQNKNLLKKIEEIVHPMVQAHRADFISSNAASDIIVLEIPLIYELKIASLFDAVAVVTTDAHTQRDRVMARGTMTNAEFELILAKQVPDEEKRRSADFIIPSDTIDTAQQAVTHILHTIRTKELS